MIITIASPRTPTKCGWRKPRGIVQYTSGNAAPLTIPYMMTRPGDEPTSPDTAAGRTGATGVMTPGWLSRRLLWEKRSLPAAIAAASHMYEGVRFRLA